MPQAPAVIIVARHGARLDAADRSWHLTTPTPYDPPLTYGGWNQSKALGARIADILHAREDTLNSGDDDNGSAKQRNGSGKKRRKQKVVIHSSPFLRCLQTSVAIGAGIAQSYKVSDIPRQRRRSSSSSSKGQKGTTESKAARRAQNEQHGCAVQKTEEEGRDAVSIKTTIRVDAFLGEWLSPDYFDHITPPPDSTLMVAAAKASLLRQEQIQAFEPSAAGNGYFPGGWSIPKAMKHDANLRPSASDDKDEESGSPLAPTRSQIHRANSYSSNGYKSHKGLITSSLADSRSSYNPPVPAYAVASTDPIPRGYCAHARDATADIDFLWDSMRQPQNWGDGGELPEEWSAMHKRFRMGLYRMISWYKQHLHDFHPDREDPLALANDDHDDDHDNHQDNEYDLVLVLVTHSAGCNAVIGALTNHPVLMDFGLSSLSMAVKSDSSEHHGGSKSRTRTPSTGRRRSSIDFGLSEEYDVKIVASTSHLQAGAEATHLAALQSPHLVPQIPEFGVSHDSTLFQGSRKNAPPEPRRSALSSALGSMRRSSNVQSGIQRSGSASPIQSATSRSASSSGLWSKTPTTTSSVDEGLQDLSLGPSAATRPDSSDSDIPFSASLRVFASQEDDELAPLPGAFGRTMSGLWGGPPATGRVGDLRKTPKRRWTMSEPEED